MLFMTPASASTPSRPPPLLGSRGESPVSGDSSPLPGLPSSMAQLELFLRSNNLIEYVAPFQQEGICTVDEIASIVNANTEETELKFRRLVPLLAHQCAFRRLLMPADVPRSRSTRNSAHLGSRDSLPLQNESGSPGGDMLMVANRKSTATPILVRKPSNLPTFLESLSEPIAMKIVVVGATGAGKTSLIRRLVHNEFNLNNPATLGVDYFSKKFRVGERIVVLLQLWDIWGQPQPNQIERSLFTNAKGAIVVYDASSTSNTIRATADWKRAIDERASAPFPIPVILVGNKTDVVNESGSPRRLASKEELQTFCNECKFLTHFFTSAKTGSGVRPVFEFLVTALLKSSAYPATAPQVSRGRIVTLDSKGRPERPPVNAKQEGCPTKPSSCCT